MVQSAYLRVILHVKHKKLPFILISTWFLIFGKSTDFWQGSLMHEQNVFDRRMLIGWA